MAATRTVPSASDFLTAWRRSLRSATASETNTRSFGVYELLGGPTSVLWAQEAKRDRDNFAQVYAETATGAALDRIVRRRYGIDRILDTYGVGSVVLQRPTAGAGGDTIYTGTRVEVLQAGRPPAVYAVAEDTIVGAADLVATVPIRATRTGSGVAALASGGLRLADSVYDPTFTPVFLTCADGSAYEQDAAYLARGRAVKQDQRVGYKRSIRRVCEAAGAVNVVVLDAGLFGDSQLVDWGVTWCYVADAGYASPAALLDACMVAVDDARVCGCDMAVLGMQVTPVTLSIGVTLWDAPSKFSLLGMRASIVAALIAEFNQRRDFWVFSTESLTGAVFGVAPNAVQQVAISSTPSPPTPAFVPVLPRYTLRGTDITITFAGPS